MIGLPYQDQFGNKIKKKDYKEKIFKELCKKKLGRIPTKKFIRCFIYNQKR